MFRRTVGIAVAVVAGVVALLGVSLVAAQEGADPSASASRLFDTASVAPGGTVTVTIAAANYGRFGRVTETLPDGFSYVSSDDLDGDEVSEDGQIVEFTLQGTDITFSYTVTASDTAGSYDFSGTLRDSDRADHDVGGAASVTVTAESAAPEGASASRLFDTASVAPGGTVTVTIAAANYGRFGRVTETLPDGFSYDSSDDLDGDEVSEDGQIVEFTLQGTDITFSYTVTASDTAGSYDFSGTLRDSDRADHDVGGAASVTVTAESAAPEGASASRLFDTASVAPGETVTVTIAAADYGRFGRVTETLPDGFSYDSSDDLDGDEVSEDGQIVEFTLQGTDITFSYTVTASDTAGSYDFSGTLRDSDRADHDVGGAASVTVTAESAAPEGASASRLFDTASVAPGETVTVTIAAANYGRFGRVTETLPDGFSYDSSDDLDGDEVSEDGQIVEFTLQGTDITFSYTVTASDTAGSHDFSGTLRDSDRADHDVGGAASVTVTAESAAPEGASASRSFDTASVAPGGTVTVTIAAANYGRSGRVTETLPDGFSYVSSDDLDGDEVSEDGQIVEFTLQGTDITFSYTVTASDTAGTHDFSGTLRDSDRADHDVGGAASVTVTAESAAPEGASASRLFDTASVAPGGTVTVTIAAANYGDFGQVVETLPAGFSYVEDSATVRAKVDDGQDVTLTILGADQTFSYRVTASSVADSHTFQGTLKDDQGVSRSIGGASSVTVMAATVTPSDTGATRSFSASSVAPGGTVTVTISAANYGDFGQVVETLPAGFSYVEDSATVRAKVDDGQDVTLTILGADQTFSYRVTASSVAGSHTFQGTLKDDQGVSRSIGGASSVTVQLPSGPASRSFSASRVSPGGQLKVTITARGYGPFGQVVETLPRGFAYVDGSITPSDTRVAKDGQDVTVTLLGEDKGFTYTVTVSRVVGTHSFSGILTDSEQIQSGIGGAARIAVAAAPRPTPTSRPSSGTGSGSGSGSSGSGGQPSSPTPRPTSTPTPTLGPTPTPAPTPTTAPAPTATTAPAPTPTAAPAPTAMTAPTATPTTAPAPTAMTAPTATPTTAPAPAATTAPTATPTVGPGVTEEEGGGLPVWASIVIIIGVLGLVVVGGLFFLRSRRR